MVIAMDGSGSIEKPNFYKMLDFVKEMIEAMDVDTGTRISILTYSTDANIRYSVCVYVCVCVMWCHVMCVHMRVIITPYKTQHLLFNCVIYLIDWNLW